jgi:hypothetical protein
MSTNIEQLLRAMLLQHLSTPGEKGPGPVLGSLVISPSEKTIQWVPGTPGKVRPSAEVKEEGGAA